MNQNSKLVMINGSNQRATSCKSKLPRTLEGVHLQQGSRDGTDVEQYAS